MIACRRFGLLAVVAAVYAGGGAGTTACQEVEPFRTRNLSPPIAIFGLPAWETVKSLRVLGTTTEIANHYRFSSRGGDTLILDGETIRTSVFYSRPFADAWSMSVEVPFYEQSGGVLDDAVDAWHSTFGLPDGGRNSRGEDELLFEMSKNGEPFYVLSDTRLGLGDVQVSVARRIGVDEGFAVRGTLKLPTGKEGMLAGSGATDWSLTMLRPRMASFRHKPAGYFWGFGYLGFGEPKRIAFPSKRSSGLAIVGGSWKIWERVGLKAQVDVFSAMYETALVEIGEYAAQATLGGWWDVGEHGVLEFAVDEDLHVSTAPDVVVHLNIHWLW